MVITARNKKGSGLTARQKGPFVFGRLDHFAALAAVLVNNCGRSAEGIEGLARQKAAPAPANSMSTGPTVCFVYRRRR
jgi:hypothetical protein